MLAGLFNAVRSFCPCESSRENQAIFGRVAYQENIAECAETNRAALRSRCKLSSARAFPKRPSTCSGPGPTPQKPPGRGRPAALSRGDNGASLAGSPRARLTLQFPCQIFREKAAIGRGRGIAPIPMRYRLATTSTRMVARGAAEGECQGYRVGGAFHP